MPLAKICTAPSDWTFPFSEYHPGLPFSPFSPLKTPFLTSASTRMVKLSAPCAAGHDTTVVHLPSKEPALFASALPLIGTQPIPITQSNERIFLFVITGAPRIYNGQHQSATSIAVDHLTHERGLSNDPTLFLKINTPDALRRNRLT
jgi:hypothetical protein